METFLALSVEEQATAVQRSLFCLRPEDKDAPSDVNVRAILYDATPEAYQTAVDEVEDAAASAILKRVTGVEYFSEVAVVQNASVLALLVNSAAPPEAMSVVVDATAVVAWAQSISQTRMLDRVHALTVFVATVGSSAVLVTRAIRSLLS